MRNHQTVSHDGPNTACLAKTSLRVATATLLVSAPFIMMPTAASAFDLGGLVQGAIVQYAAQYAGGGLRLPNLGGTHYAGVHVVSHQSRHSDEDDDDATPGSTNTPPPRDMGAAPHRVQDTDRMTPQATDSVRVVSVGRSYSDEPSFQPSR
jgi:hypothetical protein